ncbi:hypothetical protein VNO77_41790 [Canavalia gladiata]|uniref:Uncharacterized protein n=1 Tax=Canavalia gladiata TaxID=3824 RepID=A0AAN9JZI6_CANGL
MGLDLFLLDFVDALDGILENQRRKLGLGFGAWGRVRWWLPLWRRVIAGTWGSTATDRGGDVREGAALSWFDGEVGIARTNPIGGRGNNGESRKVRTLVDPRQEWETTELRRIKFGRERRALTTTKEK